LWDGKWRGWEKNSEAITVNVKGSRTRLVEREILSIAAHRWGGGVVQKKMGVGK